MRGGVQVRRSLFCLGVMLGWLIAAPAHADVMGALTACQAERQTIAELPATLKRNGWSGVSLPLNQDRTTRLIMASLLNIPAAGALTPASDPADWQSVWGEARVWVDTQILPFVQGAPQYAVLLEDAQGDLLYFQAGETDSTITMTCTLAITAAATVNPAFVPTLTTNDGEGSVLTTSGRVDNRFSRATRILIELAIRPQDFVPFLGISSDVVAVLYTNTTYPKEP